MKDQELTYDGISMFKIVNESLYPGLAVISQMQKELKGDESG